MVDIIDGHTASARPLDAFVRATSASAATGERFRCESARTLRIDVDGDAWLRPGAAIAYRGELNFQRRPTLNAEGAADALLRETAPLVRAVGHGRLYCAQRGCHVSLVRLSGEALHVTWTELLAFESTLVFETRLAAHGVGIAAGGLAVVRLSGCGVFAIASHGYPLTLEVTPEQPLSTDPHATLAWSDALAPALKTDLTWRSLVAHGGHEPFQMHFAGRGFVVVQPFEDASRIQLNGNPMKRLAALVTG